MKSQANWKGEYDEARRDLLAEAHDEIERLREALDEATDLLRGIVEDDCGKLRAKVWLRNRAAPNPEGLPGHSHGLLGEADPGRGGLSGVVDPEARDPLDPSRPVVRGGEGRGATNPEATGSPAESDPERGEFGSPEWGEQVVRDLNEIDREHG